VLSERFVEKLDGIVKVFLAQIGRADSPKRPEQQRGLKLLQTPRAKWMYLAMIL
jgi:hypothetical protein